MVISCYTLTYLKEVWNHVLTIWLNGLNRQLEFEEDVDIDIETRLIS